jgi:GNAT superfamily N-acetyltransferase
MSSYPTIKTLLEITVNNLDANAGEKQIHWLTVRRVIIGMGIAAATKQLQNLPKLSAGFGYWMIPILGGVHCFIIKIPKEPLPTQMAALDRAIRDMTVGDLKLSTRDHTAARGKPAHVIDAMYVLPQYVGQGLGYALYKKLILQDGYTLMTSSTQSEGALRLWQRLAKTPGIFVYGWDDNKLEPFHAFDRDDDLGFDAPVGVTHPDSGRTGVPNVQGNEVLILQRKLDHTDRLISRAKSLKRSQQAIDTLHQQRKAIEDEIEELGKDRDEEVHGEYAYALIATRGKMAGA